MENNFGRHERTVKSNNLKYLLDCGMITVCIVAAIVFRNYFTSTTVRGVSIVLAFKIFAPIIVIGAIVRTIMGFANKTNIELYEAGVVVGDFRAKYQDVTVYRTKGMFEDACIFRDGDREVKFEHPITNNDYVYITDKINAKRQTAPVAYDAQEPMETLFPLAKKLAQPVDITIVRERSFVGSEDDNTLYLNEEPVGGILEDTSRTVTTIFSRNSITFSNKDVTKNIYFDIIPLERPVIVIKSNRFVLKECTGCHILSKEEAYAEC